jgi:hypothetical protein
MRGSSSPHGIGRLPVAAELEAERFAREGEALENAVRRLRDSNLLRILTS